MKHLRYFKASGCYLKNIDFLKNAKNLEELNVYNNVIKNIDILKGCEHMNTMDIGKMM
mgnify:FL=1